MPLLIPEGSPGYFKEMLIQWLKWAPPNHPPPTVLNLPWGEVGRKAQPWPWKNFLV